MRLPWANSLFDIERSSHVERALESERAQLAPLYRGDEEAFANDPEVLDYIDLLDLIVTRLARDPVKTSAEADADDRNLRYADICKWRVIIRIVPDDKVVKILCVVRLTIPKPSIDDTLEDMNGRRPPPKEV